MNSTNWPARYLEGVVGRRLQPKDGDVGGRLLDGDDAARKLARRELAAPGTVRASSDDVGLRRRLAGEDEAGGLFVGIERLLLVRAVDDAAFEHPALHEPQAPSLQP